MNERVHKLIWHKIHKITAYLLTSREVCIGKEKKKVLKIWGSSSVEVKPCDKMTFVHALVEFIILSIYELELRKMEENAINSYHENHRCCNSHHWLVTGPQWELLVLSVIVSSNKVIIIIKRLWTDWGTWIYYWLFLRQNLVFNVRIWFSRYVDFLISGLLCFLKTIHHQSCSSMFSRASFCTPKRCLKAAGYHWNLASAVEIEKQTRSRLQTCNSYRCY